MTLARGGREHRRAGLIPSQAPAESMSRGRASRQRSPPARHGGDQARAAQSNRSSRAPSHHSVPPSEPLTTGKEPTPSGGIANPPPALDRIFQACNCTARAHSKQMVPILPGKRDSQLSFRFPHLYICQGWRRGHDHSASLARRASDLTGFGPCPRAPTALAAERISGRAVLPAKAGSRSGDWIAGASFSAPATTRDRPRG